MLLINWYIQVAERLQTEILELSGKSQNFIELLPSAQLSFRNENIISASKNLLKNKNLIFPYFPT